MAGSLKHKVVAIPSAATSAGLAIAKLVAVEEAQLMVGAPTGRQIKCLESLLPGESSYCLRVDLDRAKSVDEFFQIAIGQFGHIDVLVVELPTANERSTVVQKTLDIIARRLLHCLDAVLQYSDEDLHLIVIAPLVGRFALPVASAFLGAKMASAKAAKVTASIAPALRMTVMSPRENEADDDGVLARTVVHRMREPRAPDVTEHVVQRRIEPRGPSAKIPATRSKILVQM